MIVSFERSLVLLLFLKWGKLLFEGVVIVFILHPAIFISGVNFIIYSSVVKLVFTLFPNVYYAYEKEEVSFY